MKIMMAVTLKVHVVLDVTDGLDPHTTPGLLEDLQKRAVSRIPDITGAQIDDAIKRAMEIGRMYPADVAEWVE